MTNLIKAALAALLALTAVFLLNGAVLDAGWRWDDTQILLHSHQFSFWQDFIRPEVWQQFSPANLTPWLILSYEVDMILFGLTPSAFYFHQLLAIAAAAFMFCLCLNLWCRLIFAFAGMLLFVAGLPTMLVAEQLMTRHYVEGLVFALTAVYAFVWYLRSGKTWLWVVAVLLYLLAITAKEVYVPLPAVLLLVPDNDWRGRLKASLPFFAVTALYILWRGYMLGSFSGGYVDSSQYLSVAFIGDVLATFARFPALLAGGGWPVFLMLFVALWGVYIVLERKLPWRALLIAMLVLLPLVPLVSSPGIVLADRYLLLPWVMICFAMAWCGDRCSGLFNPQFPKTATASKLKAVPAAGRLPLAALAVAWISLPLLVVLTLMHGLPIRQAVASAGLEFEVQAEFLWEHGDTYAFVPSGAVLPSFWFLSGLAELKARITGLGSPVPVVDDIYLARQPTARLYTYDVNCQCMRDVSGGTRERLARYRQRLRPDAELSLSYVYEHGYFSWQFGPWQQGSYHVVSDTLGVLPLPPSGRLRVGLAENAPFYLRYSSPEGWITYSGLNRVQRDTPVDWSRNTNQ